MTFFFFWFGKANKARLKMGREKVHEMVFNQSTDQVLVDGQGVPGSVLDAERLKEHGNSCFTGGQGDSHLENFEGGEREYSTRSCG